MLIYPDSSDLINLCSGKAHIDISDLARRLAEKSQLVVFSMETLVEVAAPLREDRTLEVRRDLNRLEELPHMFVNEGRIYHLELHEAVRAFGEDREFDASSVGPFAKRLDQAIDVQGLPLYVVEHGMRIETSMIVNMSISEAIDYLWRRDPLIFGVQRRRAPDWIQLMASDRAMRSPPALPDHFVTMMRRALETHQIQLAPADVEQFAHWVYASPSRCPGIRLAYETQHRFRRDRGAKAAASDIIDLARIVAVPYVDFFVTDAAMMNYCRQASREIEHPYPQLLGDLGTVLHHLGIDTTGVSSSKPPL
jgi:hypothetical protein